MLVASVELEELVTGTLVAVELAGERIDVDVTELMAELVVVAKVELVDVSTNYMASGLQLSCICQTLGWTFAYLADDVAVRAADKHEQTEAAELRAARAVTSPHALVAQGSAPITIEREIADWH